MDETSPITGRGLGPTSDEPVLVWAVEEDILLANDAALALLARAGEGAEARVSTTLAGTLTRLIGGEGPFRRSSAVRRRLDVPTAPAPAAARLAHVRSAKTWLGLATRRLRRAIASGLARRR